MSGLDETLAALAEPAHGGADAVDARVRVYRLRPERFDALRAWVTDVESRATERRDVIVLR